MFCQGYYRSCFHHYHDRIPYTEPIYSYETIPFESLKIGQDATIKKNRSQSVNKQWTRLFAVMNKLGPISMTVRTGNLKNINPQCFTRRERNTRSRGSLRESRASFVLRLESDVPVHSSYLRFSWKVCIRTWRNKLAHASLNVEDFFRLPSLSEM